MKIFQISHKYDPYIDYFEKKYNINNENELSFVEIQNLLIEDGFYAPHLLLPIINKDSNSFYVMWNYERLQYKWAEENNLKYFNLEEILIAQLEKLKPEVIYNLSPQLLNFQLFNGLSFKPKMICWNADSGSINLDSYQEYDALLTSSIIKLNNTKNGFLHYPSQDNLMKSFKPKKKEIDILFYGQYFPEVFEERIAYIDKLIPFLNKNKIRYQFHIMYKIWTKPMINRRYLWNNPFLQKEVPNKNIRKYFKKPIFGKDIYSNISKAKIVFNISGGLKEFGDYKFNMRIFETLGNGTFMLSDSGIYPQNIVPEEDFVSYKNFEDLKNKILYYLKNDEEREEIAKNGLETIEKYYSKEKQWENFKAILEKV